MFKFAVTQKGIKNLIKTLDMPKGKLPSEVARVYKESGKSSQNKAKRIVRVDTGRLQRSIEYKVSDKKSRRISLWIGSKVHYSIYVERRYPYLFPAIESERPILISKLKKINVWR